MSVTSAIMNALLAQNGYAWQERALEAERRLAEALAIVDGAARESMLDRSPCHAFPLLTEEEQVRLYNLLQGVSDNGE